MTDEWNTKDPYRNFPPGYGVRLREVRDELGLNGNEAAKLIGYSRPYLIRLEREKRGPSGVFLQRAAEVYGVNWEWLAYNKPPKRGAGGQDHGQGPVFPRRPYEPPAPSGKRRKRGA